MPRTDDEKSRSESTDMNSINSKNNRSASNSNSQTINSCLVSLTTDERLFIVQRWGRGIFDDAITSDVCTIFQKYSNNHVYLKMSEFEKMMEMVQCSNPPFVCLMFEAVKRCADDAYAEMSVNSESSVEKHNSQSNESISLRPDSISFFAFCIWYLMMTKTKTNHTEIHSNFGYNMWGDTKRHAIKDVKSAILMQHIVLTKLDVANDETTDIESIFEEVSQQSRGEETPLERQEFCQICKRTQLRIRNWGGSTKNGKTGMPGDFMIHSRNMRGDTVFFGDERWNMMAMIMIGIQVCIEKDNSGRDMEGDSDNEDLESNASSQVRAPIIGRSHRSATIGGKAAGHKSASFSGASTLTKVEGGDFKGDVKKVKHRLCSATKNPVTKSNDFESTMTCYAPELFRRIREAFGISDEDFLLSLGFRQAFSSLFYGRYDGWLRHKDSDGKSGSIFYISHDSRFMVKTIAHEENVTLRKTLSEYADYVEKNPNTLLMKTLGMFKLRTNGTVTNIGTKKKQDFYLLVIANAFYTDLRVHETYDLKGSRLGRTSKDKRTQEFTSSVYKDLDFVDMKRKIRLQPQEAEDLRAQLRSDSAYLCKHDIIDYSFLVGIHHLHGETRESHKKDWVDENLKNLEAIYAAFKKDCVSKSRVEDGSGVETSPYFAFFTWDDFVELAYSNHNHLESSDSGCPETVEELSKLSVLDTSGSKFANFHGGCKGSGSPTVYYLAIIDTLVPFQIKKKAEYGVKSVAQHGSGFSVIPPADYSNRFIKFATGCVQATNEKDDEWEPGK